MTLDDNTWVGVDLDGTLAEYTKWQGIEHIGRPIKPMVDYIRWLLACGVKVRIFTARCQEGPDAIEVIVKWCLENIGLALPVTDRKDFDMVCLIDDRAVVVEKNTGRFLSQMPSVITIRAHNDVNNPDNPAYVGGK